MNKTIKVIVIHPGCIAECIRIPNTLKAMQELVGGHIETVPLINGLTAVVNEEGRLRGLKPNIFGLVGTIFICRTDIDKGEFISVQNADISTVKKLSQDTMSKTTTTRTRANCVFACDTKRYSNGCRVLTIHCDPEKCWRHLTAAEQRSRAKKEELKNVKQHDLI